MTLLALYLFYAIALSVALGRHGVRSVPDVRGDGSATKPSRILILGATGGTGRELVRQALERGYEVTVLVRTPAKLAIQHPRLSVIQGDVLDRAAVDAAVRGQQAVVSALGHKRFFFVPSRILSQGTLNVVQAMEQHGARRLVCETSLGIGSSGGRMGLYYTFFTIPVVLQFYFWDKTRQEEIIAGSSLDWVIVRPGSLTNAPAKGSYRHGAEVGNLFWTVRISRAEVASFMLDQVESDNYLRQAPGVSW